ncbi:hypothetical protein RhiJN_10737 [Ceratobasidium sp. AG-Ba]|nr:hypothetical protein RhiJN_10737 [Ceratobasidium sp. AG-Ba]QRW11465.1 hypothetical protein RhiLY_10464 [Ceratobasidium sp. AG-Ba]
MSQFRLEVDLGYYPPKPSKRQLWSSLTLSLYLEANFFSSFSQARNNPFKSVSGVTARPDMASKAVNDFIAKQVPHAKYIMTVCTGSWLLSGCGILDGKRATTNKFTFNEVKSKTSPTIKWVPKARWVVDGNVWTSSGVTAGQDMALEFLKMIGGDGFATMAKNIIELRAAQADDDEFATVYNLI